MLFVFQTIDSLIGQIQSIEVVISFTSCASAFSSLSSLASYNSSIESKDIEIFPESAKVCKLHLDSLSLVFCTFSTKEWAEAMGQTVWIILPLSASLQNNLSISERCLHSFLRHRLELLLCRDLFPLRTGFLRNEVKRLTNSLRFRHKYAIINDPKSALLNSFLGQSITSV